MVADSLKRVVRTAAEVSGVAEASLDPDVPWAELGFDSLVLFELVMRLEDELGVELDIEADREMENLRAVAGLIDARTGG